MPNLSQILKVEIVRLARREIRAQSAALHRASVVHRRDIAALKRHNAELERTIRSLSRQAPKTEPHAEPTDSLRFRADGFKTLRAKLGLSAEQMATLLGVSGQSVYAWEQKRTTPRRSQLPAIAALRSLGKREAQQRLAEATAKTRVPKRARTGTKGKRSQTVKPRRNA